MNDTYRYRINCDGKKTKKHAPRRIADVIVTTTVTGSGEPIREARVIVAQGRSSSATDPTHLLDGTLTGQCELSCPKCESRLRLGVDLATDELIELLAIELGGAVTLQLLNLATR